MKIKNGYQLSVPFIYYLVYFEQIIPYSALHIDVFQKMILFVASCSNHNNDILKMKDQLALLYMKPMRIYHFSKIIDLINKL